MKQKFGADKQGANIAVYTLAFGTLLMLVPLITSGSFARLSVYILVVFTILGFVWLSITRGTYILIDSSKNLLRTSKFFMSTNLTISSISNIDLEDTFGGVITAVRITSKDKFGKLKIVNTMSLQTFCKGEFKEFINTLHNANPNIVIPQKYLE